MRSIFYDITYSDMKLRIKGNSLRLRLTRSEVSQLTTEGSLFNETDFGDASFRFGVEVRDDVRSVSSVFNQGSIVVTAPTAVVADWATTDAVGIYGEHSVSSGSTMAIALEKDFRCLDPGRDEDESDNFDNPLTGESRHAECDIGSA